MLATHRIDQDRLTDRLPLEDLDEFDPALRGPAPEGAGATSELAYVGVLTEDGRPLRLGHCPSEHLL